MLNQTLKVFPELPILKPSFWRMLEFTDPLENLGSGPVSSTGQAFRRSNGEAARHFKEAL